jgi:hypothetical protein
VILTPLTLASCVQTRRGQHARILLLRAGADPEKPSLLGLTPTQLADIFHPADPLATMTH